MFGFVIQVGKLNLVDLAGSEKQKTTGAEGARLQEGVLVRERFCFSCITKRWVLRMVHNVFTGTTLGIFCA